MKNLKFILLIWLFPTFLLAQDNFTVSNIEWKLTSLKMVITYDLLSPDGNTKRTYDVKMLIQTDGKTIQPNKGITGINTQQVGNGKKIEWYFTRSGYTEDELNKDDLVVVVEASRPDPPIQQVKVPTKEPTPQPENAMVSKPTTAIKPLRKPSLILPVATTAVGVGLGIAGLITEAEAKDLYKIYEANTVESDQREAEYQAANDKHLTAQYLGIGGGVLIGTGAYLLYRTLKKRNDPKYSVVPALENTPLLGSYGGITFQYNF
ncbi:MAG: hypothetical protein AAF573_01760 [Bacteroidota bacterium]